VGDLIAGVGHLWANPELFLVLVPVQIYNFIETMNNVESAEAAGDHYPVATAQVTDGAGTMIGALFGSPFPTTVYIGHPAYKRMQAHAGYVMGVGIVIPLAAFFGLLAFLNDLIPIAAAAPVLVFVALSLITKTAHSVKTEHMAAVTIAMLPHISNFLLVQWGALIGALGDTGIEALPELGDAGLTAAMLQQGAYFEGHRLLSQGAIITGLVWGAIVASIIDGHARKAAAFAFAAAVMSSIGIIHAGTLQAPELSGIVIGYLITAAFLLVYPSTLPAGEMTASVPEAEPAPARDQARPAS
jgi:adenine/guanine/hypoxanthine permease